MSTTAILGKAMEREIVDNFVKFSLNIQSVFKRSKESRLRRTNTFLWVPVKDLACKCPKIKTNKSVIAYSFSRLLIIQGEPWNHFRVSSTGKRNEEISYNPKFTKAS